MKCRASILTTTATTIKASLSPTNESNLTRILSAYGVSYTRICEPQKGYRNTSYAVKTAGGVINLILYKSEPDMLARVQHANSVGNFLTQRGLPARSLYSPKIMQLRAGTQLKYAALYNYLPGSTIPWEAYTMDHIKALGKTMSDMHAVLADFNAQSLPDIALESIQLNERMLDYFASPSVADALATKLNVRVTDTDFAKLLRACSHLPRQQALHMDFVRGNIVFIGTQITGILDFEKAARGSVLFDIARTLAFLLVDCKYKEESKIRKYFLLSGYVKRGHSKLPAVRIGQLSVLEGLIKFFLVHDFYKFLRHNPYESLPRNEHFVRTKAMLLKHRLITSARVE